MSLGFVGDVLLSLSEPQITRITQISLMVVKLCTNFDTGNL